MTIEKSHSRFWIKTIAVDATLFGLLYAWLVLQITPAGNVFQVLFWVFIPLHLVGAFVVDDAMRAARHPGAGQWDILTDFLMAAFLAWFGHVWMAGLLLLTRILFEAAMAKPSKRAAGE